MPKFVNKLNQKKPKITIFAAKRTYLTIGLDVSMGFSFGVSVSKIATPIEIIANWCVRGNFDKCQLSSNCYNINAVILIDKTIKLHKKKVIKDNYYGALICSFTLLLSHASVNVR